MFFKLYFYNIVFIILILCLLICICIIFMRFLKFYLNKEKIRLLEIIEKDFVHEKLNIQNQIFKTVSQDIHDNVGQILSIAKFAVEENRDITNFNKNKTHIIELISLSITELKNLTKGYKIDFFIEKGIIEAIEYQIAQIKTVYKGDVNFNYNNANFILDSEKFIFLYRIIQEIFNNILKHANANLIQIDINSQPNKVMVMILDNGKGFNVFLERKKNAGSGINNLYDRTKYIGGKIIINSKIDMGTKINIEVAI